MSPPPADGDDRPAASSSRTNGSGARAATTGESIRRVLDDLLPEAEVDSKWWYWIAAVPVYFLLTLLAGVVAFVLFGAAFFVDVLGGAGVATASTVLLFVAAGGVFALVGVVVAVAFPIAMYVDARAVEGVGGEWRPDPVVYGLVAAVGVVATNFLVSVPLALYYLYRRHEAVGTP